MRVKTELLWSGLFPPVISVMEKVFVTNSCLPAFTAEILITAVTHDIRCKLQMRGAPLGGCTCSWLPDYSDGSCSRHRQSQCPNPNPEELRFLWRWNNSPSAEEVA